MSLLSLCAPLGSALGSALRDATFASVRIEILNALAACFVGGSPANVNGGSGSVSAALLSASMRAELRT